jgi:hypothetical protein
MRTFHDAATFRLELVAQSKYACSPLAATCRSLRALMLPRLQAAAQHAWASGSPLIPARHPAQEQRSSAFRKALIAA